MKNVMKMALMSLLLCSSMTVSARTLSVKELATQLAAAKRESMVRKRGVVQLTIVAPLVLGVGGAYKVLSTLSCIDIGESCLRSIPSIEWAVVGLASLVAARGLWMAYSGEYPTDTIKRAYRFCKRKLGYEVADQKPAATV